MKILVKTKDIQTLMQFHEAANSLKSAKKGFEKFPLRATKPLYESRAAFLLLNIDAIQRHGSPATKLRITLSKNLR